jgi:hypothetical protein
VVLWGFIFMHLVNHVHDVSCMMYLTSCRPSFHIRRTKSIEWKNWSIPIMPPRFSSQMARYHCQWMWNDTWTRYPSATQTTFRPDFRLNFFYANGNLLVHHQNRARELSRYQKGQKNCRERPVLARLELKTFLRMKI